MAVPSSGDAAHRIAGVIPTPVWSRNTTSPGYDSPDGKTSTMTRSPPFGPNISHSLEAHPAVGCVEVCDTRRAGARVQSADRRGGRLGMKSLRVKPAHCGWRLDTAVRLPTAVSSRAHAL